jgi:PEP-CTERM motif
MKRILAAVALSAFALGAHAQLSFSSGSNLTFSSYDPSGTTGPQSQGSLNAIISSAAPTTLTATFLGKEAGDTNTYSFSVGSGTLTNTSAIGTSIFGPIGAGNLDFLFTDTTTSTSVGNGGSFGQFTSYVVLGTYDNVGAFTPFTAGGQYALVLGFNDGAQVDGDYDDMVVGLNVAAVPEPETYALLIAGLGAVGFVSRRRRSMTQV